MSHNVHASQTLFQARVALTAITFVLVHLKPQPLSLGGRHGVCLNTSAVCRERRCSLAFKSFDAYDDINHMRMTRFMK